MIHPITELHSETRPQSTATITEITGSVSNAVKFRFRICRILLKLCYFKKKEKEGKGYVT